MEEGLRAMKNRMRRSTIPLIGVPEKEDRSCIFFASVSLVPNTMPDTVAGE